MAQRYLITTPAGKQYFLVYDEDTDRAAVVKEKVLDCWTDYCEKNWLNYKAGNKSCPEMKVKWLLECCANYLGPTEQ